MQCRENQVTGFSRHQGGFDRFMIAHLADQNHVRILAQGRFQCRLKTLGVRTNFALVDDALFVTMKKFDRILNRHNM